MKIRQVVYRHGVEPGCSGGNAREKRVEQLPAEVHLAKSAVPFREEVEQRSADGKRRGGQQHRLGVQAELAYLTNVEEVFPDDEAETSHGYQHRNGDEHQGVALISGEARERRGYPAQVESGVAERGDARETPIHTP